MVPACEALPSRGAEKHTPKESAFPLCGFAPLADVAKRGDGAKSALREILCS